MNVKLAKNPRVQLSIHWQNGKILSTNLSLSDAFCCTGADDAIFQWLGDYIEGKAKPMNFSFQTLFQSKVMASLQKIFFGQTISYQNLATLSGHQKAARAVGNVLNKNPYPLLIPCHRVILANGKIGGFAADLLIKKRLLEFEAGHKIPAFESLQV